MNKKCRMLVIIIFLVAISLNGVESEAYRVKDAVKYAKDHAESYNPLYAHYKYDCTNFVSQCLYAGGVLMDMSLNIKRVNGGNIVNTENYWYYRGNSFNYAASASWMRCSGTVNFMGYWYKHVPFSVYSKKADAKKNIKKGYVVQIEDSNYKIHHSVFCVGENKDGEPIFASHSSDYKNKSFKKLDESARRQWGNIKYLVYKFK